MSRRNRRTHLTLRQYIAFSIFMLLLVAISAIFGGMEWGTIDLLPGFGWGLACAGGMAVCVWKGRLYESP